MNITHINTHDVLGGAAKLANDLSREQLIGGHQPSLLVGTKSKDSKLTHIFDTLMDVMKTRPYHARGMLEYVFQGSHLLMGNESFVKADVIHLHNLHGNYFNPYSIPLVANFKPTIWTLHDMHSFTGHCAHSFNCDKWETECGGCPDLSIYTELVVDSTRFHIEQKRNIYAHSPLSIITPSNWLKEKVEKSILKVFNIKTIYNGVDTSIFRPHDKSKMRQKYRLPQDALLLGCAANLGVFQNPWKGGNHTINAVNKLRQHLSTCMFVNIGAEKSTESPNIIDIGPVFSEDTMSELYSCLDIFLMTSVAENCPLSILEAMACGIPVVAFNTGGIPELIINGKTGIVADYRNDDDLQMGLREIIGTPGLLVEMSRNSIEHINKSFNIKVKNHEYLKAYEQSIENFPKASVRGQNLMFPIPEEFQTRAFIVGRNRVKEHISASQIGYSTTGTGKNELGSTLASLFNEGERLYLKGNLTNAEIVFQQALEKDPGNARAMNNLGVLTWKNGQIENAESYFMEALKAAPDNVDAVMNLGDLLIQSGHCEAALCAYHKFLDKEPLTHEVHEKCMQVETKYYRDMINESFCSYEGYVNKPYSVCALVSTYKSEVFIRECLEELEAQTIADEVEIVVVDADSPENERSIVEEFQKIYSNIIYIRTPERIGIYPAWNVAVLAASARYLTSYSTNDALNPKAYEIMRDTLDKRPDAAMVYGNTYLTDLPHQKFGTHSASSKYGGRFDWPDYAFVDLIFNCRVGPHPVWRKSVHENVGFFDTRYKAIGDQDFWIRIGRNHKILHIADFTGLQWITEESLSGEKGSLQEIFDIHNKNKLAFHRFGFKLGSFPRDRVSTDTIPNAIDYPVKGKNPSGLLAEAQIFTDKGQYLEALSVYNALMIMDSKFINAYVGTAQLLDKLGESGYAVLFLMRALEIEPGSDDNWTLINTMIKKAYDQAMARR